MTTHMNRPPKPSESDPSGTMQEEPLARLRGTGQIAVTGDGDGAGSDQLFLGPHRVEWWPPTFWCSGEEFSAAWGVSTDALKAACAQGRLFCVTEDGIELYPCLAKRIAPADFGAVTAALGDMDARAKMAFFLDENEALGRERAGVAMRLGRVDEVVRAAEALRDASLRRDVVSQAG